MAEHEQDDVVSPPHHEREAREAARALWHATRWDELDFEVVLRVDVPALGITGACLSVLGGEHEEREAAFFPSYDDYSAWVDHVDDGATRPYARLAVRYDEDGGEDVELVREGVGERSALSADELRTLTLTLRALTLLEAREPDLLVDAGLFDARAEACDVDGTAVLLACPDPRLEQDDGEPSLRAATLGGGPNPYRLPLADAELTQLARGLGKVSVHVAVGMFCAVLSVPSMPNVDSWLGQLMARARVANEAEARRLVDALLRVYGHVQSTIAAGEIDPLVPEEADVQACRDWAFGYATQLAAIDPGQLGEEALDAYFAIRAATEDADFIAEMDRRQGRETREHEVAASRAFLPEAAAVLFATWADARAASAARATTPVRRDAPKVGRNDACPCGSGKKYKKCCEATQS
jgi:uncharacterized protein